MELRCANLYDSLFVENDGYVYPCFYGTSKLGPSVVTHAGQAQHIQNMDASTVLMWDTHHVMRQSMQDGKWPGSCATCKIAEHRGTNSNRRQTNDTSIMLKHLHVRVGNKCNLRCVMCGPGSSNQWYDAYAIITGQKNFDVADHTYHLIKNKHGHRLDSDNFNFHEHQELLDIVHAHAHTLESLTFHGGEPMLSKSHNAIISTLVNQDAAKNIALSYHTNMTIMPTVLDDMQQFKSVLMMMSIDGVGEINDAIRWPSKYAQIMDHYQQLKHTTDFTFSVNHTLHALNYEHLPRFMAEMVALDIPVTLNPVFNPIYASASIYDDQQKQRLMDMISCVDGSALIRGPLDMKYAPVILSQQRAMFNRMWDMMVQQQSQDMERLFPFAAKGRLQWP